MAKKRRRSKWEKKIKARMNATKRLKLLMGNERFISYLMLAIKEIDQSINGQIEMIENIIRYYFFDKAGIPCVYDVVIATDEGIFICGRQYPESEIAV